MPQLEQGDLAGVSERAARVAAELAGWIDRGYDVIALVPSCALMLKFEWPLIVPKNAPHRAAVEKLAGHAFDISQYIVDIARRARAGAGIEAAARRRHAASGLPCQGSEHGSQGGGNAAADPGADGKAPDVKVIERCSGHGGSWGIMKENYEVALKIGKPVATQALKQAKAFVASECPLAGAHIAQGMERLGKDAPQPPPNSKPCTRSKYSPAPTALPAEATTSLDSDKGQREDCSMTTAPARTVLSRADILSMDDYARIRADKRREMVAVKKNRRVSVGPSRLSISRATIPCGSRSTRCFASRKAGRSRSPVNSAPTTR